MTPLEKELQFAVAKLLREHALPDWRWTHIASGEARDIVTAVKLKRMGVRKGWPDILLLSPIGVAHCLELKRRNQTLTEDQEAFRDWCDAHGVPYRVAFHIGGAMDALNEWGCLNIRL